MFAGESPFDDPEDSNALIFDQMMQAAGERDRLLFNSSTNFTDGLIFHDADNNASSVTGLNHSDEEVQGLLALYERYKTNRNVSQTTAVALAVAYAMVILFGTTGNSLVVTAVLRKSSMRTPRNLFVFNLASK